jgi:hypothetical protein
MASKLAILPPRPCTKPRGIETKVNVVTEIEVQRGRRCSQTLQKNSLAGSSIANVPSGSQETLSHKHRRVNERVRSIIRTTTRLDGDESRHNDWFRAESCPLFHTWFPAEYQSLFLNPCRISSIRHISPAENSGEPEF